MITIPAGVRVLLATRPVDFRKGAHGLAALASEVLAKDPFSGVVIVFRAKRADRVKLLVWDGSGLVLVWKQLQHGAFQWPPVVDGVVTVSPVAFAALFEGLDWTRCRTRGGFPGRPPPHRLRAVMRNASGPVPTLPKDAAALRALLLATLAERDSAIAERDSAMAERDALLAYNERLHHLLLMLKRMQFGARFERLPEDQLQLGFEDL